MSLRLVPKSATLNDLERRNGRYFTEFGKHAFRHITASICGRIYARVLYFVVRARCRRKESSRSLSHLPMSFLLIDGGESAMMTTRRRPLADRFKLELRQSEKQLILFILGSLESS